MSIEAGKSCLVRKKSRDTITVPLTIDCVARHPGGNVTDSACSLKKRHSVKLQRKDTVLNKIQTKASGMIFAKIRKITFDISLSIWQPSHNKFSYVDSLKRPSLVK